MSHRGERFILDLSDEEEGDDQHPTITNKPSSKPSNKPNTPSTATPHLPSFIGDIIERAPSAPKPPTAPVYKKTATGFPEPKKRSRFMSARGGAASTPPQEKKQDGAVGAASAVGGVIGGMGARDASAQSGESREEEERRQIDLENQQKLAAMSPEEIEQERKELLEGLDPALVRMLMARGSNSKPVEPVKAKVSDAALVHKMRGDLEGGGVKKTVGKGEVKGGKGDKVVGLEDYLKRANIDDGRGDTWVEDAPPATSRISEIEDVDDDTAAPPSTSTSAKQGSANTNTNSKNEKEGGKQEGTKISKPQGRKVEPTKAVHWLENDEKEPDEIPESLQPASEFKPRSKPTPTSGTSASTTQSTDSNLPASSTDPSTDPTQQPETVDTLHFPPPPTLPELDPSSPNFLQDLHSAYFPSLPSSPASLAWLAPLPTPGSAADLESSYSPAQASIPASSLRFDFKGQLLPPRISRAMPTDRGLHHHADAPEAGGYTIPELARLMRSSVPQQRGIAVQTLGRILYRLGKGEWGQGGEMTMGLWRCVEEGGVVGGLVGMAGDEGGEGGERHRSVRAYATEAVWLWRMGGGKVMGAI